MRILCRHRSWKEHKGGGERSDSRSKHRDLLFVMVKAVSGLGYRVYAEIAAKGAHGAFPDRVLN
jgi:hypothetical protein